MTIDKAIEILTDIGKEREDDTHDDYFDAVNLAIEALKAIKLQREDLTLGCPVVLKGETKE